MVWPTIFWIEVMNQKAKKRCAIYTRKSHEEGLDKEFNSLEAQREAGEDKIRSQKHEGWVLIPEEYDDGGISGGTMDRPGLQKLLSHIEMGLIDVVVVYKIDRLSRSMLDFLSMIKFFDEHNVSFVSVTQDFNTDNPMGRLMLNILQSFAQFEREVTSERIRDKIAASKKRGMWMGGVVPLGYDAMGRKLEINANEAETVQYIFKRYIEIGSMTALMRDLKEKGCKTKSWVSVKGKYYPPKDFNKSSLYRILGNHVYIGKIRHKAKGQIYNGQHTPIIDQEIWDKAQAIMSGNTVEKIRVSDNKDRPYLLKGLLKDADGFSLTPSSSQKGGKLYRYYVSLKAIKHGYDRCAIKTVSAQMLEDIVLDTVKKLITGPEIRAQAAKVCGQRATAPEIKIAFDNFATIWDELFPVEQARIVHLLIEKIIVHPNLLKITFRPFGYMSILTEIIPDLKSVDRQTAAIDGPVSLEIPVEFQRKAGRKHITAPNGRDLVRNTRPRHDRSLIKALVRAHQWQDMLDTGRFRTVDEIVEKEKIGESYVRKIIRLTELAPDITTAIINGQQPRTLTLSQLMEQLPICWTDQRQQLGI